MRRGFLDAFDQALTPIAPEGGIDQHDMRPGFLEPLERGRSAFGGRHDFEFAL